jgi:hypothetical protein
VPKFDFKGIKGLSKRTHGSLLDLHEDLKGLCAFWKGSNKDPRDVSSP